MSTAIDYQPIPPSNTRPRHRYSSHEQSTNDHVDALNGIELAELNSAPPPAYTEQADESNPTTDTSSSTRQAQTHLASPTILLQIETTGKPILSLPLPPHPDPIPIYLVDPSSSSPGDTTYLTAAPKFISLRPSRSSGSCYLISGDTHSPSSPSSSSAATNPPPLSTTTYRFGPGRPPRVRLFSPYSQPPSESESHSNMNLNNRDEEPDQESTAYSSFDILSSGLLTRAVRFKPPRLLGDDTSPFHSPSASGGDAGEITEQFFEWRYASRKERKAYAASSSAVTSSRKDDRNSVDSLLILSKTTVFTKPHAHAHAQGSSSLTASKTTSETITVPLARLVRSSALRTKGSSPSSAGNGGRLEILDLEKAGYPESEKSKREMVLVMVVTTCLVMLKREVDRRRAQQIAVLAGAVGGG